MTTAEQYKKFEELDKLASQGGGVERVERQHANGHMTARERIDMLLDKGTFNEMDKFEFTTVQTSEWIRITFRVTASFVVTVSWDETR